MKCRTLQGILDLPCDKKKKRRRKKQLVTKLVNLKGDTRNSIYIMVFICKPIILYIKRQKYDLSLSKYRTPSLSNEAFFCHIKIEHVQRIIYSLLLSYLKKNMENDKIARLDLNIFYQDEAFSFRIIYSLLQRGILDLNIF